MFNLFKKKEKKEIVPCEAMIDIETLDTTNTSVVFQVAVVMFDKDYTLIKRKSWNLNVDEQLTDLARTVSASTLAFHLKIPKNALAALNDKYPTSTFNFMLDLMEMFTEYKPVNVWSKGSFDFDILEDLLVTVPWEFYQKRELRTLMAECKVPKGDVSHTAIEDCIAQINQLMQCRDNIWPGEK